MVSSDKNTITVINYEDSTIENILPERHVFMGNTYFYGKIVSMFGSDIMKGKKGMNKMVSYMLMSEMMKGNNGSYTNSSLNSMLPFMMMGNNGFSDMFDGMFDLDTEDSNDDETTEEAE